MSDFQQARQKFEPKHFVINVNNSDNIDNQQEVHSSRGHRRISIGTLEWLNGKVESLRRKFSAAAHEQSDLDRLKLSSRPQRKFSAGDGDLIEMCEKYQICGASRYTRVWESFESIVTEYGKLVSSGQVEIYRDPSMGGDQQFSCPRGILLLPLSSSAGQALLDFSEMGGFSLGRGSRVAPNASRSLSRTHCMIYLENNQVYLKDCDSKTGTFVNGKLLGSSVPTLLENFDIIQMGYGGNDSNDSNYIQAMTIFLSAWNPKDLETVSISNRKLPLQSNYSRTFSNSVSTLMHDHADDDATIPEKKLMSPLVSSPRMNRIIGKDDEKAPIVFEMPRPISDFEITKMPTVPEIPTISPRELEDKSPKSKFVENSSKDVPPPLPKDPSPQRQAQIHSNVGVYHQQQAEEDQEHQEQYNYNYRRQEHYQPDPQEQEQYKVHYHRSQATSIAHSPTRERAHVIERTESPKTLHQVKTPLQQESQSSTAQSPLKPQISATTQSNQPATLTSSPRPPVPKPRQMKKGLSKSAEVLIEMDLQELSMDEPKEPKETTATRIVEKSASETPGKKTTTVKKMPIETALAVRKSSLTPKSEQVLTVDIPEFLKSENLKIPSISPAQNLLKRANFINGSGKGKKLSMAVDGRRADKLERIRAKMQFSTIVQGATMKRFEIVLDFGSATCDISDGLAVSQVNKKDSLQVAFNNFRINWSLEALNLSNGCRVFSNAVGGRNNYNLMLEGEGNKFKFGSIETDLRKATTKMTFEIDDTTFKGVTGSEIDETQSLPLKALNQLTYFYPHLELPVIILQGIPDSPETKVSINLVTSKKSVQIGKLIFETQKISWSKRKMAFAVDLDSAEVEIDSVLSDSIQVAALLHCLRYHIDY